MTIKSLSLAAALAAGIAWQPAAAQDSTTTSDTSAPSTNGTSFRGLRVEGNFGGDRFQSQGIHNDNFGYGGTVGFDGMIGDRIVIGAEGSYWQSSSSAENCQVLPDTNNICHKSFEEWGAAVRAGYLVTPQLLVFAKGGYVNNEQRRRIDDSFGTQLVRDHFNTGGYQLGGGVEYTLTQGRMPVYLNAQYVYSQYDDHTARQRIMGGVGVRFR
ncbi:outer membrane immunogenic protein [Novosphingobium sp. PhB165]|uniref:outer membrane protein n=1 Tax=Novosphingobium sp. PhB165 TaxID=2485105 RepID=UPI001053B45A|nr:outer membrane beta-barrel protein [Novosphingobium sp. PhB165]TCM21435.1 outer membrane immunogenic protein [Novosphingobium sp. PhB165]